MRVKLAGRALARLFIPVATAAVLIATPATAAPVVSPASCNAPITAAAQPNADSVSPIPIANNGWRSYSTGLASYLRRCGGYVYARHQVYIDTRNLPYGHKLWLRVSTQRSDGKWALAHEAAMIGVTGHQKIEEVILYQRRGIGGGLAVERVHVWHTATTPGSGAVIPRGSTLKGTYRPWNGPKASPRG